MATAVIYALTTCPHCVKTKELLDTIIPGDYDCHYIDRLSGDERNDRMRELRLRNPTLTFPTIVIGNAVILGHKEDEIRAALAR